MINWSTASASSIPKRLVISALAAVIITSTPDSSSGRFKPPYNL
ncbi:hypothetical protein GECvBN5_gp177 [Salmonella phage GEC_vB_N5]|uniref:Uncharacterized protein n=1 Tax=Salmonella phage GEC_vB_N5 TaxID=2777378 RepID=A0A7S9SRL8_9CAUD|nr:hypothetical protein GECvBN5_gp177 [Salmonella phage GEC_vB_N5]